MKANKIYQWAVIGAGPAGIIAVGQLLDHGINGSDILWLDPEFKVGDFGVCWNEVNSNTSVDIFHDILHDTKSFHYEKRPQAYDIDFMDPEKGCPLQAMAEPLAFATTQLQQQVDHHQSHVDSLEVIDGSWQLSSQSNYFYSKKVITATGAKAKSFDYDIEEISLACALKPSALSKACKPDDQVAVFGSSHSAMIIIRNLIEAGVKNIVNFYLTPIRYAVHMDDWILYDNTGLKMSTAQWTRENISQRCLPQIKRYHSNTDNINQYLPACTKAIYAIGFESRNVTVKELDSRLYDTSNGIIAPGLFGFGIAYPQQVTDPLGHKEMSVGLGKFTTYLKTTLPLWMQYDI